MSKDKPSEISDEDAAAATGGAQVTGGFALPEVDDEVLVGFLNDDPRSPVVVGGLWNGSDSPPKTASIGSTQTTTIGTNGTSTVGGKGR